MLWKPIYLKTIFLYWFIWIVKLYVYTYYINLSCILIVITVILVQKIYIFWYTFLNSVILPAHIFIQNKYRTSMINSAYLVCSTDPLRWFIWWFQDDVGCLHRNLWREMSTCRSSHLQPRHPRRGWPQWSAR